MGYNMKRGAAPKFKELGSSPAKVDLTKKTGLGPMAGGRTNRELVKDDDDQSREATEDAMGVDTNIKMPKIMKDGAKNKTVQQDQDWNVKDWEDKSDPDKG